MRMAITYRSEKKKILRSQIALVQKVIYVLRNCEDILTSANIEDKSKAYTELILEQTDSEIKEREAVSNNQKMTEGEKAKELHKLQEYFYYRRIINGTYYKDLKTLIISGDYI